MLYFFFVAGLLALDLFSKYWVHARLEIYQSWVFIPGLLEITRVNNRGAAFGILQGRQVFFLIFTFLALFVLIWVFFRFRKDRILCWSFLLTIGGALGNLYDRLAFGYVRDFVNVPFFAVFNLADAFIVLGMLTISIRFLFFEDNIKLSAGPLLWTKGQKEEALDKEEKEEEGHDSSL